jgi:hypothetical protein
MTDPMFGRVRERYPIEPEHVRQGILAGLDTRDMAEALNDKIRSEGLPYELVTEAEVYSALGRADRVIAPRSAA